MMYNPTKLTAQQALKVIFAFFALMVVSAFFIEHVLEVPPCKMCWWQRYTHWMITGFALFALVMKDEDIKRRGLIVTLVVALISLGIGAYQSLGQLGIMELPESCQGGAAMVFDNLADPAYLMAELQSIQEMEPSCGDTSFTIFGLTLAGWNAIMMTAVSATIVTWLRINRKK